MSEEGYTWGVSLWPSKGRAKANGGLVFLRRGWEEQTRGFPGLEHTRDKDIRRRKVEIAYVEGVNPSTRVGKLTRFVRNGIGGLGAQATEALCELSRF